MRVLWKVSKSTAPSLQDVSFRNPNMRLESIAYGSNDLNEKWVF
jgi:hypothetical protein